MCNVYFFPALWAPLDLGSSDQGRAFQYHSHMQHPIGVLCALSHLAPPACLADSIHIVYPIVHFGLHSTSARRGRAFQVYITQHPKPHPAPSFPLLPPRHLLRFSSDLRGSLRHACPLFSIAFLIRNSPSFFFNSPRNRKNHVDLRCSGSSVSSDVGVIPKRRGGRLLFPLPSFNEHPLMTHFRVSEGSYLAPSSPLLPAQPLVRSRPDLHGPVRHACALFPTPFFVGNPRSFSFNSPRTRKQSRGFLLE